MAGNHPKEDFAEELEEWHGHVERRYHDEGRRTAAVQSTCPFTGVGASHNQLQVMRCLEWLLRRVPVPLSNQNPIIRVRWKQ